MGTGPASVGRPRATDVHIQPTQEDHMAPDPSKENTNGESDGDLDSPEQPGDPGAEAPERSGTEGD